VNNDVPVELVVFDLDETLLDDGAAMRIAVAEVASWLTLETGVEPGHLESAYVRASDRIWSSLASSSADQSGMADGHAIRVQTWFETLRGLGAGSRRLAKQAAGRYRDARRRSHRLFPDVEAVLDALAERVPLAVLTNGPGDTQIEKLDATGIRSRFKLVAASGNLGLAKPDRRAFQAVLDHFHVGPRSAVHVGDSTSADVAGATSAGLRAVWLNRTGRVLAESEPKPWAELTALTGLPELLGLSGK
jgi:putative hydrolase of the HAD superfamily